MKALRIRFRLGLLIGLAIAIPGLPATAQTTPPKEGQPLAPGLIKLTGDDDNRAKELDKAINAALEADRWDEATARADELLALRTQVQGPKHFETVDADWRLKTLRRVAPMPHEDRIAYLSMRSMHRQAESYFAQGKYAQAQVETEKVLEICRRLLTDEHPITTVSIYNLGMSLNFQGRYTQAQTLLEKALEIRRRLLTDEHPITASSYAGLALNLNAQAKYAQSQLFSEKALDIRRRLLGDNHPDTAGSFNGLAFTLDAQGKYALAQSHYEKALEIRRRVLPENHPQTANSYNNLALNFLAQGRYAQAQPIFEKALEIRRRVLPENHPDTASSFNNLAGNLNVQGKYAEAQPLYEKALEVRRRSLPDNHPDTAGFYNNLADNLDSQDKYALAQPLHEKALEISRVLTDDHPQTALLYYNLAFNLRAQGKYDQAQPLFEKALEISRRLLTDDHPQTARAYFGLAMNQYNQGRYTQAQSLFEKSLEIYRRVLPDDHPLTSNSFNNLASSLNAQGKYLEARDQWLSAAQSLDKARLRIAFAGLERAGGIKESPRLSLAAVQARLGQPAEAWQALEEDFGRGLLDELAARQDQRLAPAERDRLRELTAELEQLDKLVETTPKGLDQAGRARRFEELKRRRELASIALGEFQTKLVQDHDALAGEVAGLGKIQAALPADAALVAWVDLVPLESNEADPDGEHWGVVVRSRGVPAWIPIAGTGDNGLWTKDDVGLAIRVRAELRRRPGADAADLRHLVEQLRVRRLEPLANALAATADGLPAARRLIVLPSRAMSGIPVEILLAPDDTRTVSYSPSATVFGYLRDQPHPDRHAGLLALGDPIYERPGKSSEPEPMPDHGLLVNVVMPGSNAAKHGLKQGDVLLAYNGIPLNKKEDLKVVGEGDHPIDVEVWRDGRPTRKDLAPGQIGVVVDLRPAPEAIAANRAITKILVASRSGDEDFPPLPGTRYEVEALARLFQADDRPARTLIEADASEPELDRLAASGELGRFAFIHLATHGVIDESVPLRSAVILTQTGLPDPLEQVLHQKPAYDGRLSVREIQRTWKLKAELVTLSACSTARGRVDGGEGFVGFTQALLISGTRSVCLSLWAVDDTATSLLMQRFYANLLGRRPGLGGAMPKAEALREAKVWLRGLRRSEVLAMVAEQSGGVERGIKAKALKPGGQAAEVPSGGDEDRPYASPHFWAAFVLAGDPD
jgi:tetratricopeptide (TPR) repeat protein